MDKQTFIKPLLKAKQTVFTFQEILLGWNGVDPDIAKARMNYFVRNGDLVQIRRGIYAVDQNYDRLELATKIYTPAYISFETVLTSAGVIFQYYGQIFAASYLNRKIDVAGQNIVYRRLKEMILYNPSGIEHLENYAIAQPERAFLDMVYLFPNYFFDHLDSLHWDLIFSILPLYQNLSMEKRVINYHRKVRENA